MAKETITMPNTQAASDPDDTVKDSVVETLPPRDDQGPIVNIVDGDAQKAADDKGVHMVNRQGTKTVVPAHLVATMKRQGFKENSDA